MDMLQKAREISGIPYRITSGARTPSYNKSVGGVRNSSHLLDLNNGHKPCACDIEVVNKSCLQKILTGLIKAGFTRIGVAVPSGFIHADSDIDKPDAIWFYRKVKGKWKTI